MRIDIISVAPDLLESPFNHSIIKRAKEKRFSRDYYSRFTCIWFG